MLRQKVIFHHGFVTSLCSPVLFREHILLEDQTPKPRIHSKPQNFSGACFLLLWGDHILRTRLPSLLTIATLILVAGVMCLFTDRQTDSVTKQKGRGRKGQRARRKRPTVRKTVSFFPTTVTSP